MFEKFGLESFFIRCFAAIHRPDGFSDIFIGE